jgi:homoserine O-acetyltransferase
MLRFVVCMLLTLVSSVIVTVPGFAHGPNDPPHQLYKAGDLRLKSGEVIQDFAISYVTHGTLNAKKSNAILMVTAIGGNHHRIDFLIGPGRALDFTKYFIIATDAIGNGLTTSPSTSATQPRMQFPRFTIRDMVELQRRLLEHLGIARVVAVIGPSMGGMQVLQWGVSHPDLMDSLIALVPLGRTPAWTTVVLELARQAIMSDPAWNGGNYMAPPEQGMRLWAGIIGGLATQSRPRLQALAPHNLDLVPWLKGVQDAGWRRRDANDWIYQSWAYDAHNLGTTPGFNGDYYRALQSIKAKTLIMAGQEDLLNPEAEAAEAARYIRDARFMFINPPAVHGHAAASGALAPESEHLNAEIARFLDLVIERSQKLE